MVSQKGNNFILTRENYHTTEANQHYMSRGQYLDFLTCEAAAVASLCGEWVDEPSKEFLIGQYVHSFNDNSMSDFIANHPGMFKRDGGLKAEYVQADAMIETLRNDPFIMYTLEGQKEVIITAEMFGAKWKVMLDSYNPEKRRMVDIKTARSITEHHWNSEYRIKESFVESYNYLTQAAIYAEVERIASGRDPEDWLDFYIVAVSKQDPPDKAVIDMRSPERYIQELSEIKANMPRVLAVKNGEVEPVRCGLCSYCRATKQLTETIHYSLL